MNLNEGKLFTIEALNSLEGFVWPDSAVAASFCLGGSSVALWASEPKVGSSSFWGGHIVTIINIGYQHPDWRNSLITREEFEAVDGWVRCSTYREPKDKCSLVNVMVNGHPSWLAGVEAVKIAWGFDNVTKWRYHKSPVAVKTNVDDEQPSVINICELYKQYSALEKTISDLREQINKSVSEQNFVFDQIEAYNLAHGIVVTGE